jgi:hypothetical protein
MAALKHQNSLPVGGSVEAKPGSSSVTCEQYSLKMNEKKSMLIERLAGGTGTSDLCDKKSAYSSRETEFAGVIALCWRRLAALQPSSHHDHSRIASITRQQWRAGKPA